MLQLLAECREDELWGEARAAAVCKAKRDMEDLGPAVIDAGGDESVSCELALSTPADLNRRSFRRRGHSTAPLPAAIVWLCLGHQRFAISHRRADIRNRSQVKQLPRQSC